MNEKCPNGKKYNFSFLRKTQWKRMKTRSTYGKFILHAYLVIEVMQEECINSQSCKKEIKIMIPIMSVMTNLILKPLIRHPNIK